MPLFKFQLFYSNLCFLIFFFEISIASLWCSQLINKKCNMLVFTLICTGHFIFFWRKRKYVALWSRPLLHATQILLGAICHSVQWNSILQLGKLPQEKKILHEEFNVHIYAVFDLGKKSKVTTEFLMLSQFYSPLVLCFLVDSSQWNISKCWLENLWI